VFFRQKRMGRGGRPFFILKFRTMVQEAPKRGGPITCGDDPRITRIGRLLRKTKLDELPQLINVLRGDMSLVGPRPEVPKYVEMFRQDYEEILRVRPGITDLASVKFCDEAALLGSAANPEEEYLRRVLPEKIRLAKEYVAKFTYRPAQCRNSYSVVVVWKDLEVYRGQKMLFDKARCFFYITNVEKKPAKEIVFTANDRCGQENLLGVQKDDVRSLTAPLDNLHSNGAYMAMAMLAWSLKAWAALMLRETGRWEEKHREEKRKLLRMEFSTFRQAMVNVPAQILRTGRKIVSRLLAWNPWQNVFFRLLEQLDRPLRC